MYVRECDGACAYVRTPCQLDYCTYATHTVPTPTSYYCVYPLQNRASIGRRGVPGSDRACSVRVGAASNKARKG